MHANNQTGKLALIRAYHHGYFMYSNDHCELAHADTAPLFDTCDWSSEQVMLRRAGALWSVAWAASQLNLLEFRSYFKLEMHQGSMVLVTKGLAVSHSSPAELCSMHLVTLCLFSQAPAVLSLHASCATQLQYSAPTPHCCSTVLPPGVHGLRRQAGQLCEAADVVCE